MAPHAPSSTDAAAQQEPALAATRADGETQRWSLSRMMAVSSARPVKVWDPQELAEVTYSALPLPPLLDAMLGPSWRQASDLLGIAQDGYSAPIAVSRLLNKPSWLAVARLDAAGNAGPLRMQPPGRPTIDGGPFYIIWDSLGDPALRAEGDHGWPYQLVRLDVVDLHQRYPGLAVAPAAMPTDVTAAAAVARGERVFGRYCLPCHAIAGSGGRVGPELVEPVGAIHTWQRAWLAQWIDDPQRVRHDAKMPKPPLPAGDRAAHIADILAYLAARTPPPAILPADPSAAARR